MLLTDHAPLLVLCDLTVCLTRISKLEFLDEIEELELVLDHYVVAWGVKVAPESSLAALKDTWGLQRYEAPR